MLRDRVLNRDEFTRLLRISSGTLATRVHAGEFVFAFGCRVNAEVGGYLPLDAVAIQLCVLLGREIGAKPAAELVRTEWDAWLRAVQAAESDPRLYAHMAIVDAQHHYFGVGVSEDRPAFGVVGPAGVIFPQLAGYRLVRGISIPEALRQLHVNARDAGIKLPARLTPPLDDPSIRQYRREIAAHQRAAAAQLKVKAKQRPNRTAWRRRTAEEAA